MGDAGDFAREFVLDAPMMARVRASGAKDLLDLGCGEGRFSRAVAADGVQVVGVDPTPEFVTTASQRHPQGRYVEGRAEAIPLSDASVDLVVAYLCLMDVEDLTAAFREVTRVLRPGGRFLVANLSSFATAVPEGDYSNGWLRKGDADRSGFACDNYHAERSYWIGWRGIRVRNWHRPLQGYMSGLLAHGLHLTHFEEPVPHGGPQHVAAVYQRAPMFVVMEWQKPSA